ncbi:hypothetical protein FBD94_11745 [Pedobacter hiemivivus]|uniref:chitinase n=1 Tax=Pedobacter hiemivivus TaxID=2530454 RepID=A0A4U1GEK2_9SPHI|nr:glycosyl hydrolase family 18 protein [Pedobacter hiemivivus]TKC61213.1 hypothetical protein FBD94_11745 [Pedobacter hiemivivus]
MKNSKIFIQVICLVIALTSCAKSKALAPDIPDKKEGKAFFVVGYLFGHGNLDTESAKLDFTKITHLNIAFLNPDAQGVIAPSTGLAAAITRAHENKVKVLFSFGGGNAPVHLKELIKPGKRTELIKELVKLTNTYNFDGVDVDLEGDFIDLNYEDLIVELSNALKPHKKLLTAAVATWNGSAISDKALALFDLVNIMSYDQTGPWGKDRPGPHSTYEAAETDFSYWNKSRAVPASKLTLGLPFYGYGFGPAIQESYTYGDIVKGFRGAELVDFVVVPNQGTIYYNGLPTIKKKVDFALKKQAGGVMIWQLLGDATGDKSLLTAINTSIR